MPELPEVETVMRGLAPVMEGQQITKAEVRRADLRWPFPENMAARLQGQTVLRLRRRSKYILADLSSGETLIIHLGMSGRMLIEGRGTANFHSDHTPAGKHDHVILQTSAPACITFNDARRFGAMDLAPTEGLNGHWLIEKLGPEPLGNRFDSAYLADALKARNTPIKAALLDQRVVAGLGNIYVCEVLHRTGISPRRKAKNISRHKIETLLPAIRDVLSEAIEAGGSSLRDYRQADGELGYFQHKFAVYDRADKPCPKPECGGTIKRIVQSGRSSFYCATCQR
ncbi:bifunctional DNA-formamidopyrimidine glycosylase/DNA-(apurinic or apyrimidinic site) lyase [Litoreibacter roseus]|uniref:Formamidopyrimidine-DNA glycosylase n=1 Tax=Litoreibacter roseus TaxID=2601869 RepID=A0A6N6JEP8_9RHOB|nr:bifunctional DNA-formamidopyrimidine glycosylase/DNA-(apurinic or apyrimidinic site) lyase [Litoreibacter roseus]GFE64427.1 formamidopyrimidine-DNA glycosylase [Litoreibacter roseus]